VKAAEPVVASPVQSRQASLATPAPAAGDSALKEENESLKEELREAREKIRYLELQVESMRANMRKASEALLHAA
jgi:coronin-1B/1C/6